MRIRSIVCGLLVLAAAVPLDAQEPDLARAKQELEELFARPEGTRVDAAAVVRGIDAMVDRYGLEQLGPLGYVEALRHYFARDYDAALASLERFFEAHRAIEDPEHRNMAGRIYLVGLHRARAEDRIDDAVRAARRALELYDNEEVVVRLVAARAAGLDQPAKLRLPIAREIASSELPDAKVDALLATLYGKTATATGPAEKRARPTRRARPTTLKPFAAKTLGGEEIALEDYRGKVVLVDFWATWCGPCLREMPNVVRVHEKYHDRGFEVIGISLDREGAEQKIRATAEKLGMTWPQIYDGGGWNARLAKENGIRAIPWTFLVGKDGEVVEAGLRGGALEPAVREALGLDGR